MIDEKAIQTLQHLRDAKSASFIRLVEISGLNPSRDFRAVDLRGVDFGTADLHNFDFTDADLSGADLSNARLSGAILNRTVLSGAKLPKDKVMSGGRPLYIKLSPFQQAALSDIDEYVVSHRAVPNVRFVMPPGTGKTAFVDALLELLRLKQFHENTMIVVDRLLDRDVLVGRMFPDELQGKPLQPLDGFLKIGGVQITTTSALAKWLDREPNHMRYFLRPGCIIWNVSNRVNDKRLHRLRKLLPKTAVMLLESGWEDFDRNPIHFDLRYFYDVSEAAREGVLDKCEIITSNGLPDVASIVQKKPKTASGVLIVDNQTDVEAFAKRVAIDLYQRGIGWRLRRSAEDSPEIGLPPRKVGVIDIMRVDRALEEQVPAFDFIVALTALPDELLRRVAYPARRDKRSRRHRELYLSIEQDFTPLEVN